MLLLISLVAMCQEPLRLPAMRTQGVSSIGEPNEAIGATPGQAEERDLCFGGTSTLPLRQTQNWGGFETKAVLIDFDPAPLRGLGVAQAWLHLALARGDLHGIGICTVLAPWAEGATAGVAEAGAPSWLYRSTPPAGVPAGAEHLWAWSGSRFYAVAWMHPALRYSHADPDQLGRYADAAGTRWLRIPVEPRLVEALARGATYGWVLTDDKGLVAEAEMLDGLQTKDFRYDAAYDPLIHTRRAVGREPWLEVVATAPDTVPPAAPAELRAGNVDPADGSASIAWTAPGDDGMAGTALAYRISVTATDGAAQPYPLHGTPLPATGGQRQSLWLAGLAPGSYVVGVRAVDRAGNVGPEATTPIVVAEPWRPPVEPLVPDGAGGLAWARIGGDAELLVTDDLLRIEPVAGEVLVGQGRSLPAEQLRPAFAGGPWSAAERRITLRGAAGETVSCQLHLRSAGGLQDVAVAVGQLAMAGGATLAAEVELFRLWYLPCTAAPRARSVWAADPLIPLDARYGSTFTIPDAANAVPGQLVQGVFCDLRIPPDAAAGTYTGRLVITAGTAQLTDCAVQLDVLPMILPERVSWPIELNAYTGIGGFAGLALDRQRDEYLRAERQIHQLAHRHRTTLNIVPYSQSGRFSQAAVPTLSGRGAATTVADWTAFDERYGPYLDGTAFTAAAGYRGPGAGEPVTHLYLPFHENWPMPISEHLPGAAPVATRSGFAAWARTAPSPARCFDDAFAQGYMAVARQFADHFAAKGWTRTRFQFFHNNKYYFSSDFFGTMGRNGTSRWLLDESIDYDDFAANAFLLGLARRGVASSPAAGKALFQYRVDASAPWLARGLWDGVVNLDCSSWLTRIHPSVAIRRRWFPDEQWQSYGGGAEPDMAADAMVGGYLMRYCWGAVGDLTYWNNLGTSAAWRALEGTAILYPAQGLPGRPGPREALPSLRLKAMRRGQQDVEYVELLAARIGRDRAVLTLLRLAGAEADSAATLGRVDASRLARIRAAIATLIASASIPGR